MGAAATSSPAEAPGGLIQSKDNIGTSQAKRHTKEKSNLHLYFPYSLLIPIPIALSELQLMSFQQHELFHEGALKNSQAGNVGGCFTALAKLCKRLNPLF